MYTPSIWRYAALIVFAAMMGLADALLVAWWLHSVWGVAASGGAIAGLTIAIAWALWRYLPAVSMALLASATAIIIAITWHSPRAGASGAAVALAVLGAWVLLYDVWLTGRAQAELVSAVTPLGGDGRAGRALIVYHQGRGPKRFQAQLQRALAEGLRARGWQVDLMTASRETPTDLSRYDLLVLGAQSYNWCPARPVIDYLDRLGDLGGMPVVVVVSGGGATERAMRVLRERVAKARGSIVEALEVWTVRQNEERHGSSDPLAIMRRAGSRLEIAPRRKTA